MDNYQLVRFTVAGMALINWASAPELPDLKASVTRNETNSSLPSPLQVVTDCDLAQLNTLVSTWRQQSSAPIVVAVGCAQAFSTVAPDWPVRIQITRQGNTLVVGSWVDALKVADWDYLNSDQTQAFLND